MRIRSMTATFGKLEHATLTLEPGLNVISAPNEWGKSTWCAFVTAMLYGVDTRAKSTKSSLADKERYAPWSGSPMAGRMEVEWQGRLIAIERRTKGRIPMGEFKAYETGSGLPVPELNGANCGQMLLGVERSVFTRAGFIRLSDLPVTQDETLRSRLNALVTTGDESGDGERLARGLKELKNRCRYNRTGLLPQAEAERAELEGKLRELDELHTQQAKLQTRLEQVNDWIARLENHRDAMAYAAAQTDAERVAQAKAELEAATGREQDARQRCEGLPEREQAQWAVSKLQKLDRDRMDLEMETAMLPEPEEVALPELFRGMTAEAAARTAREDGERYAALLKKRILMPVLGLLLMAAGAALALLKYWIPGIAAIVAGLGLLVVSLIGSSRRKAQREELEDRYGAAEPEIWLRKAEDYGAALEKAEKVRQEHQALRADLDRRKEQLNAKISRCTRGRVLDDCMKDWQSVLAAWDDWADAYRERQKAGNYLQTLLSMAKSAQRPAKPSELNYTEAETARLLSDSVAERQQLLNRLSLYQGRLEAMGERETVRAALDRVNARLHKLEGTYAALTIAQQTLEETVLELQRRFAPRISRRAQELMGRMTGGRYTRLTLGEGFVLSAGTGEEDTLREALWRSDGTVDQLYLALRLAVAEALTPEAPLVLDDALARFDDERMRAAMDILRDEAESKQVILFTCQGREKAALPKEE